MAVTEPRSLPSRVTGSIAAHLPATVIALAGLVAYSVLRVSYAMFYGRFGVEPEEVGLGQTQIIAYAVLALIGFIVVSGAALVLAYFLMRLMGLRRYPVADDAPLWRRAMAFTATPYWIVGGPVIIVVVSLVLFTLPEQARSLADQVEEGETVRPPVSFSWRILDLHVKALPARVTGLGPDPLPAQLESRSLRYLGEAGGVAVLYDWKSERVLRVPTGSVVVLTSTS
jgi:hypothetical protein